MISLLLVVLATPPPPSAAYVQIQNQGVAQGYARVVNCSGSGVTCTVDANNNATFAITSSGASTLPGGSVPQLQFNADGGAFGGVSNITSDGVHEIRASEVTPSAPAAGSLQFDYAPAVGWPQAPTRIDAFMGLPISEGMYRSAILSTFGTKANWLAQCHIHDGWGITAVAVHSGEFATLSTQASSNPLLGWDAGSFLSRQRRSSYQSGTGPVAFASIFSPNFTSWRGTSAGAGGFILWTRFGIESNLLSQYTFVGMAGQTGNFGTFPSNIGNTMYIGADNGQSTLHVCSSGTTPPATCTDLGASFPATTIGATYDVWLAAAPNASSFGYYLERLDSAASTWGTVSSSLPDRTAQLAWHTSMGTGIDAGSSNSVRVDFGGMCLWDNW